MPELSRRPAFAYGVNAITGQRRLVFPFYVMAARKGRYIIPMRRYLYA